MASTSSRSDNGASASPSSDVQRREQPDADSNGHGPAGHDPDEAPSVDWGWHGSFPKARQVMGWLSAVFLLANIAVNYDGIEIEDWVLIVLGGGLVVALLRDLAAQRRAR